MATKLTRERRSALERFSEAERTKAFAAFRADPRNLETFTKLAPKRAAWSDVTGGACIAIRDWLGGPFAEPMAETVRLARKALDA